MSEKVDYRLKILGRYRRGTSRERFNLWFDHPGLRHGFDALDRERDDGPAGQWRPVLMDLGREDDRRPGWVRNWSSRVRSGSRERRRGSSPGAASVGSGGGR